MTFLIILLCIILIAVIVVQIGRVTELSSKIRGEDEAQIDTNNLHGVIGMIFMVLFLIGCAVSAVYYKDSMLGFGPHSSASEHGDVLDSLFNTTLWVTGIVFVITQILLFWYAYKFRGRPGRKVNFLVHDTKLEVVWTMVPAVVMSFLVIKGLAAWNEVMADIPETYVGALVPTGENEFLEIEATGEQFGWTIRYPGADGRIGARDYKLTTPINPLGQDLRDEKNFDDFHAGDIVLPKGALVRVRILAKDVLHNFDLPHFRVKMDAIPGLPTYFVFKPVTTTEEYRARLGSLDKDGNPLYPEYWEPSDPTEPDGPKRWETFEYELACAELCGTGHFSMQKIVRIVEVEEYEAWLAEQNSWYLNSPFRNSDGDPHKGQLLKPEIDQRSGLFKGMIDKAIAATKEEDKILPLKYITFVTGGSDLEDKSRYEVEDVYRALIANPNLSIELRGHTDNTGSAEANQALSQRRAETVLQRLASKGIDAARMTAIGFGQTLPIGDNETEEGRQENRRTEIKILTQ